MFPYLAQVSSGGGLQETVDTLARTPLSKVVIFVVVCSLVRLVLHPMLVNTEVHRRNGAFQLGKIVNELFDAIIYAGVFVFMLIRPFVVQTFNIPTGSMLETIQLNDYIIANKAIYRFSDPKPGDVVVFRPPYRGLTPDLKASGREVDYIKRCIGTPGDLIEIKDGFLYRNNEKINEPYFTRFLPGYDRMSFDFKLVNYKNEVWPVMMQGALTNAPGIPVAEEFQVLSTEEMDILRSQPAIKIPEGHYLMVGDNREESFDGRGWGLVNRDAIIGKAMFIWLPLNRFGRATN